jgi:glutathione S-transferase
MLELWQTEWCPASRRVRQRLTELGIDYLTRQVPVEKEQRRALRLATGSDVIPALACEEGEIAIGEETIARMLDERFAEPAEAEAHRLKAAKARRRHLEEECKCLQPATRSARPHRGRSPRPSSASARS